MVKFIEIVYHKNDQLNINTKTAAKNSASPEPKRSPAAAIFRASETGAPPLVFNLSEKLQKTKVGFLFLTTGFFHSFVSKINLPKCSERQAVCIFQIFQNASGFF